MNVSFTKITYIDCLAIFLSLDNHHILQTPLKCKHRYTNSSIKLAVTITYIEERKHSQIRITLMQFICIFFHNHLNKPFFQFQRAMKRDEFNYPTNHQDTGH